MKRRFDTLEGLRGIAALLVVMFHVQDVFGRDANIVPFGGLFGAGDRGVDLFFVLSGFIIMVTHGPDIGTPARAIPYLYKRVCRVFPSVWILTIAAAVVYAWHFGGSGKAAKLEPWNVAASLLLLPQNGPPLVNVTWTLTYEILFYALFALLIVKRRFGLVLLVMWQGAVALDAVGLLQPSNWLAKYYLRPICLEFGIGMICGLLILSGRNRLLARKWIQFGLLAVAACVFLGGLAYEGLSHRHALEPVRLLVYGVAPGALILALATIERDVRLRVPAPVIWLGSISYALYLVNFSVVTLTCAALFRLRPTSPDALSQLGCVFLSVVVAGAFNSLLDQPIQQRLRRLGRLLFEPRRAPLPLVPSAAVSAVGQSRQPL